MWTIFSDSVEATALGASESSLPGTASAEALHTFTLDSGASRCFFRDCTALTPLPAPVPVRLADPSGCPVVACSSTVLPCSAGRERYFLLVVDDYMRYTTVFPLRSKGQVVDVLIRWVHAVRLQLRERFHQDLPILRLHSDRGGEFSSDLLRDFCRGEGILQSFTLPDSPQQNGIVPVGSLLPSLPLPLCPSSTSQLFLAPSPPPVHPLPPQGPAPPGVSQVDPLPGTVPVEGAGSGGAEHGGVEPGGAELAGVEPGGAEPEGVEPGGAESEGAESRGAEPRAAGAGTTGDTGDTRAGGARVTAEAGGIGGTAVAGPGGARTRGTGAARTSCVGGAGAGDPTELGATRAGGTGARGTGAGGAGAGGAGVGGTGAGGAGAGGDGVGGTGGGGAGGGGAGAGGNGAEGAGAGGAGAVDPGAGGAGAGGAGGTGTGGTVLPRPYFVPPLQHVLGVPSSTSLTPPLLCPPRDQSQPPLQPTSPLPAPSPYIKQFGDLTERREPASRLVSPVRTARRIPRSRPPPVPGTHTMALPRAASPTDARLLATAVTDPSFESAAAFALVDELLDFAVACRLDYASALEDFECLAAAVPRFASMLLAPEGDSDAPDIPTPRSYAEAIMGPFSSQWQATMDTEMASWNSTGTYVDAVPPSRANIVDGMWIFRVKRPPGSPPAFKARYVARGFSQRQGVDYFQTFSPTPKMTTPRVLLHVAAQRDYELHSLDFSTAFLQGSLHEEIWLRRPPGFTGSFPVGTQTTLAALGFPPSTADPSLFLRTNTSLPPFYVLVYVDDLIFATADTKALTLVKSELQKRHTCTDLGELRSYLGLQITRDRARRTITLTQSHMVHQVLQRFGFQFSSPQPTPLSTSHSLSAPHLDYTSGMGLVLGGRGPVVLTGHADAYWVDDPATQRSSQGYTFSLGFGSVSWRSTRSSLVLSSICEAEIYAGAMAAQELHWLTYLLIDLGEQPRSPLILPRTPPSLPAMTSLWCSGRGGDGGGGSSWSGEGRPSSHCENARWGVSSSGQMRLQQSQCESLPPKQLREWYASRGGGGGSSGGRNEAVQLGVPGRGRTTLQRRPRETLSPQQLHEWYVQHGASRSSARCPYVIRTGDWAGQTCGTVVHTQSCCFSCLSDTRRAEFGDAAELPRWLELVRQGVDIFALDYDTILTSMYALTVSVEGDCSRGVPPDPGIAAAALGASESGTLPGTTPAAALHTFTLDSSASACYFRDSTTLTPLSARVPVQLADPSGGPVVARSSTDLLCPAVSSGSLSGLHLPSFSANLVSTAALEDAMVTTTTPGGQRMTICTCTRTGRHLATFTRRPRSSLYTLATEPPQIAASAQVRSPPLARVASCRTRIFCGTTAWVTPPCHAFVACTLIFLSLVYPARRSSPLLVSRTIAPLQTLHMDVWGPARVSGQDRERYILLVVDDYTRYTTVFPLRSKGQVVDVLIPWIRTVRLEHCKRFGQDLPILRLHSDRGVMEVARTSMIHAAAPHFLWPFAVRYAAHQLNLWPRVSLPETSPTLRWTGEVGDASVFRVWGSRAFVRDTSADKLSPRAIPCVFLGFVPDAPGWQFYHPTSRRVFPSQDVTFDESVPFYRLFPYRSAPSPPPPLFLAPGPPPVAVGLGPARGAASWGAASGGAEPGGAESEGTETGVAEPGGVATGGGERGGTEPEGVETGGAALEGAESGGAEPQGATSFEGFAGALPRLSPQQLREWFFRRARLWSGASGARGAGVAGAGAAGTGGVEGARAGDPTGSGTTCAGGDGAGGARVVGTGAGGAGVGRPGVGGAGAGGAGAVGPGGDPASPLPAPSPYTEQSGGVTERRKPASRPISPARTARRAPRSRPPPFPGTHTMTLRPSSVPLRAPLPAPPESSLPAVPDLESDRARAASPTVSRLLATPLIDPSFESASACALVAELLDFAATCRLDYATARVAESVSDCPPSIGCECALSTDVLEDRQEDFECLAAAVPRFASMLLAPEGDPDAPDILTPRSYAEAITGPYSSNWQAAMDAEMASWKSTGTYVDEVPPPGANIVDGMWIFRVKRPPGSPPAFKARYVARGFSQRQGVDYFQTFSPTPKMTTLRVLLHVAPQRNYELHSLDFSTAFLQGSLHEEIWPRRPPGFTGSFLAGTQWSLGRPVYGLRQAPREWHDTLRTTLAALGFAPTTADPSLFLRTDTSLPPFYILVYVDDLVFATADTEALTLVKLELQKRHTCTDLGPSALRLPVLLSIAHSSVYQPHALSSTFGRVRRAECTSGMGLVLGGRGPVILIGHADDSWVDDSATQRSSQGYTFSLGFGSVSWRSTRSSSVLSSSCEAEIYAGAMAAQEQRWLTYLLTDLGEQPRSPPVLYVDNKAMIALCQEHRLELRTKHIALRYFLARDMQQRGQLRLAYVATRANTADIFTKALPPGDHQRFVTVLGLVPILPHLLPA
ncbi:unnamed protein product [Closterium sp. NIES-54]